MACSVKGTSVHSLNISSRTSTIISHFMVNSWNSWNLRCFSFARHMLWAYLPPHGCIFLRSQMLNQFSRMAIGRGNNILTSCQPMHSGSSRMRELPACVFTFSEKKKKKMHVMLQGGTPLCLNNLPASLGQEVEASSSHNHSKLTSERCHCRPHSLPGHTVKYPRCNIASLKN